MSDQATVMAVDDTIESLAFMTDLLRQAGYKVLPADSGELALQAVAVHRPDLIVLDVRMPSVDGTEVCRRLKANEATRHIPIILVSASVDGNERVAGLKLGAADYVSKPFRSEELLTRIKNHLELSRATIRLEQRADALRVANEQLQAEIGKRQHVEDELRDSIRQADRSRRALLSMLEDQKRGESERDKLRAQLLQAQKMEAVGRLAGGVAHDFNNMLSVIMGNAELAMQGLDPSQPLCGSLQEILRAAERSAGLTRQLLAFARRQTIAPKVLDLNDTVEGMLKMLRRLIGEDIDLTWHPEAGLWPVKLDPSQVDQILANLCVNARDAIAGVGEITIDTGRAVFDEVTCARHAEMLPGEYVMLAVSDNGCGIDKTALQHLFEPFYTTKEIGRGTGLGLATVYGIVKQNGGYIDVYSELGKGTTVKIYLPRDATPPAEGAMAGAPRVQRGRGETILVVEDEPAILQVGQVLLESIGYTVLAAGTPEQALRLADEHDGEIDLLVTDVIMPRMSGKELADRLQPSRPGMRCLFMSGYTSSVIAHRGVLDEGVQFIQKPFMMLTLAAKVREVLDHI